MGDTARVAPALVFNERRHHGETGLFPSLSAGSLLPLSAAVQLRREFCSCVCCLVFLRGHKKKKKKKMFSVLGRNKKKQLIVRQPSLGRPRRVGIQLVWLGIG